MVGMLSIASSEQDECSPQFMFGASLSTMIMLGPLISAIEFAMERVAGVAVLFTDMRHPGPPQFAPLPKV
jgi:hypothetical protein